MKCEGCKAHCCRKFIKFITIHDAARIMKSLKLEPTDFLDLRPAEGVKGDFPEVLIREKPHFLALESKMAKENCIFQMEISHSPKCGVHGVRPMGCRTYPFELGKEGLETVHTVLCPRQYWPQGDEREEYIRYIQQSKQEREEYKNIVEEWNQEHGETGHFLNFMDFALGKLEGEE